MRRFAAGLVALLAASACAADDPIGIRHDGPASAPPATAAPAGSSDELDGADGEPDPVEAPDEPPMDLILVWHQHQPRYPVVDDVVSRPWVRVHAAKDYVDMAILAEAHPDVALTINITPSLLLQLEELAAGRPDTYRVHTLVPADEADAEQRGFILSRFFDTNPRVIERFPRYQELADRRAALGEAASSDFAADELRDLQVLFNLAWTDPSFLADEPLATLVDRGEGFTEADKATVLEIHDELVAAAIEVHARLAAGDQIEITTTPLAHPILPLLIDTGIALVGDPSAVLPDNRFQEFLDAEEQVIRGLDTAERLLGARPRGMWPGEGAVSDDALRLFARGGVEWVATGENVLARSLGLGSIERDDAGVAIEAAEMYRPRLVETPDGEIAVFFRDNRLSDLIGFEYSQTEADAAVDDFVARLRSARDAAIAGGNERPVVTVILDGENAWEHYPNDGIDFLTALYERLGATEWINPTTPSAYLVDHGGSIPSLDGIHPGAWFSPDYGTWIGETEEARAWDLLRRTRIDLRTAERRESADAEALAAATDAMLFAEGSDWFWWYGTDQDSGNDAFFDEAFRELLGQVYDLIGEPRPAALAVPLIPGAAQGVDVSAPDLASLLVDGAVDEVEVGTFATGARTVDFVWDEGHLYLATAVDEAFDLYLGAPRAASSRGTTLEGRVLGFDATALVRWDGEAACVVDSLPAVGRDDTDPPCAGIAAATGLRTEIAIPIDAIGTLVPGELVRLRFADDESVIGVSVPDIGGYDVIATVADVEGDDHGPGTYTYPADAVFGPGVFDLTEFVLGETDTEVVFGFTLAAPVSNPWNSASGLSVQTFDVYLDLDADPTTGASGLLPGRDAVLADGGWDAAVTIEGWASAVFTVAADGSLLETTPALSIAVLGDQGTVTVRVPKAALPEVDFADATFGVAVLGQEGFPSAGVRRVRDVAVTAAQWQLGGAPAGGGHSRIVDWLHPDAGVQEAALSDHGTSADDRPAALPTIGG